MFKCYNTISVTSVTSINLGFLWFAWYAWYAIYLFLVSSSTWNKLCGPCKSINSAACQNLISSFFLPISAAIPPKVSKSKWLTTIVLLSDTTGTFGVLHGAGLFWFSFM